jgi:hypothetical protein
MKRVESCTRVMRRVESHTHVQPSELLNNEIIKRTVKAEILRHLTAHRVNISQLLLHVCRLLLAVGFNIVGRSALHLVQNAYPINYLTIKSQHENKSATHMFETEIQDMQSTLPIKENVFGDIETPHMQLFTTTHWMLLRFVSQTTNFVIQIDFVDQTYPLPGLRMRNNLIDIFDCFDFGPQNEQLRQRMCLLDVLDIHEYIREPNLTAGQYCLRTIMSYVHLFSYYPSKISLFPTRCQQSMRTFYPLNKPLVQMYIDRYFVADIQPLVMSYLTDEHPPQCYGCKNTTFEYFKNVLFLHCPQYIAHEVRHRFPDAYVQYFFCSNCVVRALQRYTDPSQKRQQGGPRYVPDLTKLIRDS